jgi:hypothetical protein
MYALVLAPRERSCGSKTHFSGDMASMLPRLIGPHHTRDLMQVGPAVGKEDGGFTYSFGGKTSPPVGESYIDLVHRTSTAGAPFECDLELSPSFDGTHDNKGSASRPAKPTLWRLSQHHPVFTIPSERSSEPIQERTNASLPICCHSQCQWATTRRRWPQRCRSCVGCPRTRSTRICRACCASSPSSPRSYCSASTSRLMRPRTQRP